MAASHLPERHLVAEVSAGAIRHNLGLLRGLLPSGCALWPVVKADAYGLGLEGLWPVLASGADGLCVSNAREALALRRWGYEGGLLVLFPIGGNAEAGFEDGLGKLVSAGVDLTVSAMREVEWLASAARVAGRPARAHLKVDTGMHRGGAGLETASELVGALGSREGCLLAGVYTHFATAEDPDRSFVVRQLEQFLRWVRSSGIDEAGVVRHAANSAALLEEADSHLDLVRPGLAVYGYRPADHLAAAEGLRPALRLVSHLMQIKDVGEGSGCGYGMTYRFDRPSRIGLVPIGYADGYLRALGNRSSMRVRGIEAPCRGTIAMDQTIIDLTGIPGAGLGDEVEIISPEISAGNSVEGLARSADTIPYEILTRLGARIERRLVE